MYNSFSQSLMKKYGWSEGNGLGKSNQGITEPIKAFLKFDSHGISYKELDLDHNSKWSNIYSNAVSNLQVDNGNCISMNKLPKDEEQLSSMGINVLYKSFIKSGCIKDGLEIRDNVNRELKSNGIDIENNLPENEKTIKKSKKKSKTLLNDVKTDEIIDTVKKEKKSKKRKRSPVNDNLSTELEDVILVPKVKKSKTIVNHTESENCQKDSEEIIQSVTREKKSKKRKESPSNVDECVPSERKKLKKSKKSKTDSQSGLPSTTDPEEKENRIDPPAVDQSDAPARKKKSKKSKSKPHDLEASQVAVVPDTTFMTCHPAARCGIGMSGKLARIQKLHDAEQRNRLSVPFF